MEAKDVLTGAAVAVLLGVLGLILLIGVILVMMWVQPGIEHSPSEESRLLAPAIVDSRFEMRALPWHEPFTKVSNCRWSEE